jgi:hypothetical protein
MVGSAGIQCFRHAHCPVLVVAHRLDDEAA